MISDIKVFISLNGHANNVSLPLRMGMRLTTKNQQFATLKNADFDETGTNSQRVVEVEKFQRKHYTGTLSIANEDEASTEVYEMECRVVLEMPASPNNRPIIVTILRRENNKGDLTVTRHLEGMLKRGKINIDDIIRHFHPAYVRDKIRNSNDCEDIFTRIIATPVNEIDDLQEEIGTTKPEEVISAISGAFSEDVDLKFPARFKKLQIGGVRYSYVLADCYVEDVWMHNEKIMLRCLDSKGDSREIHSFKIRDHLSLHHKYTFNYLRERIHQRAIFAVCNSEPCKGLLAESVTSILLQLMRSSSASTYHSTSSPEANERHTSTSPKGPHQSRTSSDNWGHEIYKMLNQGDGADVYLGDGMSLDRYGNIVDD